MFTSVLVGLDGSTQAQVALAQAILIGQRFRSRIVLAHVSPPPGRTGEMALGAPWMEWTPRQRPQDTRRELEQAAQMMLDDAAGAVRRAGLEAETVVREGSPARCCASWPRMSAWWWSAGAAPERQRAPATIPSVPTPAS